MKSLSLDLESTAGRNKAARDVSKQFSRSATHVVSHAVDEKLTRRAGVSFRNLSLTFADSQTVTMGVKTSGDVFEVKVNGKVIPIANQDDHARAIAEIADRLESTRSAFQKALARTRVALPPSIKVSRTTMAQKLTEKRDALKEAVSKARDELASLAPATA